MSYGTINGLNITSTNRIALPIQRNRLVYTGNTQSPEWEGYNSNILKIKSGSTNNATDAGKYPVTFQLNTGYVWMDGTTGDKISYWTIERLPIPKPCMNSASTYNNGIVITANLLNVTNGVTITQNTSTVAGKFNAIATPDNNHCWTDNSYDPILVPWEVKPSVLPDPTENTTKLYYTGKNLQPNLQNYNSAYIKLEGEVTGINAGTYVIYMIPDNNHCWSDGTRNPKKLEWHIYEQIVDIPNIVGEYVYTGNEISANFDSLTENIFYISGQISGTGAGDYICNLTPDNNHCWTDGTKTTISIPWTIKRKPINNYPSLNKLSYTFTGKLITPDFSSVDSSVSLSGNVSGTEDKDYWTIFTLDNNRCWPDGSIEPFEIQWSIVDEEEGKHIGVDVEWETISEATQNGTASQLFEIGSFKYIKFNTKLSSYLISKNPKINIDSNNYVTYTDDSKVFKFTYYNSSSRPLVENGLCDVSENIVKLILIGINHNSEIEGSKRLHWLAKFNTFSGSYLGAQVSYFGVYDFSTQLNAQEIITDLFKQGDKLATKGYSSKNGSYDQCSIAVYNSTRYTPAGFWHGTRRNFKIYNKYKDRVTEVPCVGYLTDIYLDFLKSSLPTDLSKILVQNKKYYIAPSENNTTTVTFADMEYGLYNSTTYFWPLEAKEIIKANERYGTNVPQNAFILPSNQSYKDAITQLDEKVTVYDYFKNGNLIIGNSIGRSTVITWNKPISTSLTINTVSYDKTTSLMFSHLVNVKNGSEYCYGLQNAHQTPCYLGFCTG